MHSKCPLRYAPHLSADTIGEDSSCKTIDAAIAYGHVVAAESENAVGKSASADRESVEIDRHLVGGKGQAGRTGGCRNIVDHQVGAGAKPPASGNIRYCTCVRI